MRRMLSRTMSDFRSLAFAIGLAALLLGLPQRSAANFIYVTTLSDKISATGGCSLKEAIYSSNLHQNTAIRGYDGSGNPLSVTTQCVAGSGNDTIVLPPNGVLQITQIDDDSDGYTGPAATVTITSSLTIEGYGATIERATAANMRLFVVGPHAQLAITNTHVKGFAAHGGNGATGGGGGLAAGGAVFIDGGTLIVTDSTFDGNAAIGGNGSTYSESYSGGGGGGMGGDGGAGSFFGAGGGGGGSRGSGAAQGIAPDDAGEEWGGGGGGTVFDAAGVGTSAFACGGAGSGPGEDASSASCKGGGGGGGSSAPVAPGGCVPLLGIEAGQGGNGNFGGGGGGGGNCGNVAGVDAGSGGFGGGGGAGGGSGNVTDTNGGSGGFGGGAGVSPDSPGNKGPFAGSASHSHSGGGAGLGGAIFNLQGTLQVVNSTFTANNAVGGRKADDSDTVSGTGEGHGGAIFAVDGSTTVENDTIDGNLSSGSGGGIYVWQDSSSNETTFILRNSIVANSGGSEDAANAQCTMNAKVVTGGDWRGNLIQNDDPSAPCDYSPSTGTVSTEDPQLGPLKNNGGLTPTMALGESSPAWNTADATTSTLTDQRASRRPELGGFDIGAYELCSTDPTVACPFTPVFCIDRVSLILQVSPPEGGTVLPAAGTTLQCTGSVVSLVATPAPGYTFVNWSGNATFPNSPSTPLVMVEPQVVTANFAPCDCAINVTGSLAVTRGPYVFNLSTGRFVQTVSVTNTSSNAVTGPISLVLDNLSTNAILFNLTAATDAQAAPAGSPYVNASATLSPGQTVSFTLQFTDPARTAITYSARVLAGSGAR